jgi:hypothetical protein
MVGGIVSAHGSTIIREVISSTSSGADVMSALPGLVRQMLDEEAWREFAVPGGKVVRHGTFGAFIEADPPSGLGGRKNQLVALCGTDADLADRVRLLLLQETPESSRHRGRTVTERSTRDGDTNSSTTSSNSAEYVVSRLKRDDPELAEKVVRGEVTAHAAAREKGWRKPRVILSTPEKVADSIRKHMSPDARHRLAELLLIDGDEEAAGAR